MRFQAATVSSHSMILVILVTDSLGVTEGKGVAVANCARDCENKLSPVTATNLPPRATGLANAGRDGRPVLRPGTPATSPPFFFFHHQRCLNNVACPRIFSYHGEPRSLPFHLALPGTCDDSLRLLKSLRLHIDTCRYLEHVALSFTCHAPSRRITINLKGINRSLSCAPQLTRMLDIHRDLQLHVIVRLLYYAI